MKKTWFDKNTGRALHYGRPTDPVATRLESAGHPSVAGVNAYETRQKMDFNTGRLVADPVYDQIEQDRDNRKQNAKQAYLDLKAAFDDPATDWASAAVNKAATGKILILFRYLASQL